MCIRDRYLSYPQQYTTVISLESCGKRPFRLRVRVREFLSKNFGGWGWVLSFLCSWTYRLQPTECRVRIRVEGMTTPTPSLRNFYSKILSLMTLRRKSCFPKLSITGNELVRSWSAYSIKWIVYYNQGEGAHFVPLFSRWLNLMYRMFLHRTEIASILNSILNPN